MEDEYHKDEINKFIFFLKNVKFTKTKCLSVTSEETDQTTHTFEWVSISMKDVFYKTKKQWNPLKLTSKHEYYLTVNIWF